MIKDEQTLRNLMSDHVVRLNRDGLFIDSDIAKKSYFKKTFTKPLTEDEVDQAVDHIFSKAEALAEEKKETIGDSETLRVKVLVHVHGGLNTFSATDDRVLEFADKIQQDPEDWHYPIFISWPSNAPGTWAEGVFRIREGRKANPVIGAVTSPLIFTSNLLNAVANYPSTFYYQVTNEKDRAASATKRTNAMLSQIWKDADDQFCKFKDQATERKRQVCEGNLAMANNGKFRVNRSMFYRLPLDSATKGTVELVTAPVRLTAGTLWNSSIAQSAWDIMKRRTQNIFFPPQDFQASEYVNGEHGIRGGRFFEALLKRATPKETENTDPQQEPRYQYEITLVGHSMGTIVLNHALIAYQHEWLASGALKNIVYMAAACSINEGLAAVTPLVTESNINFYNLTLNRVAEVTETHAYGIVPSGSLLVSIDQHHEAPEHPLERTLGAEVNVLSALKLISERLGNTEGQIDFKAFDRYPSYFPAAHGDFTKIPFWKNEAWSADNVQTPPDKFSGDQFNAYTANKPK